MLRIVVWLDAGPLGCVCGWVTNGKCCYKMGVGKGRCTGDCVTLPEKRITRAPGRNGPEQRTTLASGRNGPAARQNSPRGLSAAALKVVKAASKLCKKQQNLVQLRIAEQIIAKFGNIS